MDLPITAITQSIKRGDILLSDFDGIDHQKFFVVMGVSEDAICGFFFINSNIHRAIFNKQELLNLQYPLRHVDYPFLRYNSFLCASSVIERSVRSISAGISEGTTSVIGRLKDEHIDDVIEMVRKSHVISAIHKKKYFT